jgi:hypothetical protein
VHLRVIQKLQILGSQGPISNVAPENKKITLCLFTKIKGKVQKENKFGNMAEFKCIALVLSQNCIQHKHNTLSNGNANFLSLRNITAFRFLFKYLNIKNNKQIGILPSLRLQILRRGIKETRTC